MGAAAVGATDAVPRSTDSLWIDRSAELVGRPGLARAAVDPGERAVGEAEVAAVRERLDDGAAGDDADRLGGPPPDRLAGAGVVVVRPHEEVEPVEPRLGERRVRPHVAGDRLRGAERGGVDRAARRRPAIGVDQASNSGVDDRLRVDQRAVVDDDPRRVGPAFAGPARRR